jgi:nicotianamine synthase
MTMLLNKSPVACSKEERAQSNPTSLTPPSTPRHDTTAPSSQKLTVKIQNIHEALKRCTSLAPSDTVNDLLTRLVTLCIVPYDDSTTTSFFSHPGSNELCLSLRRICSEAEGELETFWAREITALAQQHQGALYKQFPSFSGCHCSTCGHGFAFANDFVAPKPSNLLSNFPYFKNYVDLSRLEGALLDTFLPSPPSGITFIGSGPLPLSSLCLLDRYPHGKAWNIDRDVTALAHSRKLSAVLGYGDRMQYLCADITSEGPGGDQAWTSSTAILLAALVGTDTKTKIYILSSLARKLSSGTIILVRSARGLRSVLYPVSPTSITLCLVPFRTVVSSL